MNGEEIKSTLKKYNLQSWSKQRNIDPIPVEKADGIYFWDYDGNRYTDMSAQLVNMNLGFGNKKIGDAIKEQVDKFCFVGPSYGAESRAKLAKKIIELMPDNMGKVFFTNAGAESNENAVKMARMFTGKSKVFSRYRSYHGSSFGAGNLTGEPRRYALEPGIPGFVKFFDPYVYREAIEFESEEAATKYYLAKLREQILYEGPDSVAAIVMETITGSNGVIIPPKGYLKGVRALCDEFNILIICDEVMTGWGRTGKMFAFENFDVKPDIVTFAKGVTCGYVQLGGVVVSKEIAAYFDDNLLSCGLTYSGHPLACAAGVACVNYYEEADILENVNKVGKVLGEKLEEFKEKYKCVGDVRYIGLFSAIELVKDKKTKEPMVPYGKDPDGIMGKIIGMLKERKFMTYSHENMVLIAAPLIITEEQLVEELAKVDEVLKIIDEKFI
ncbi:aspartate aminotransferase family protein [Clostridium neonatale]|uniref:Aspartate aminotransferase family protein n=1 Tax=Clostridium neonatale TaxID=137838 RepID=A0A2A7MIR0_9CLOT|nr:aminotransferase class III-fold pyridoxal phosphate-dependent enzyme [Clostridium neonatale]PEG24978.1 aspartate aminotransferase family protein [Clostridium neonatale]PEG31566.1 aspartate aminotransferase family protein [Clostridium neonatale]CAH0437648.1 Putative aminotransferase [Clostridium neonatale]CAI3246068.1 putative aminotransferase [Clostridium neonatale]CAI3248983.1 putative aminotransferase [Clostridium neonatale]